MSVPKKKPFQDVWIAGLDSTRSQVIDGGLARIYFQLSAPPPFGWSYIFTQVWQATEYAKKCQAGTESGAIWIDCKPEDLQPLHMEQLESALAQTNAKYRARLQEQSFSAIRQKELQLQLQSKLQDLGQILIRWKTLRKPAKRRRPGSELSSLDGFRFFF
jgi:hypothetical protein